jgi:hypothetical protein
VSDLLPYIVRHAVVHKSVFAASQSFGTVALTLLVVLLLEYEALGIAGVSRSRQLGFAICSAPLLAAVALTIVARFVILIH